MIKICPECLNISVDVETCKFCGFPFAKKIIGRLEDYYFYDTIELINNGQLADAKFNLAEKKSHLNNNKLLLLTEKIAIVEELTTRADDYAQKAIKYFQNHNLTSALEQITSAVAVYKHPRFVEIKALVNEAIIKKKILIQAENKYQQSLSALKKEETVHGLHLLKEALTLDPSNILIKKK